MLGGWARAVYRDGTGWRRSVLGKRGDLCSWGARGGVSSVLGVEGKMGGGVSFVYWGVEEGGSSASTQWEEGAV